MSAVLQNVAAVRDLENMLDVLLDQQDGDAVVAQPRDQLEQALHVERGKAFGRLVEQEDARAGHQGTADGAHLLLAPAERSGHLLAALGEDRQQLEHALERLLPVRPRRRQVGAELEILEHGHERKQASALGNEHDRPLHPFVGRQPVDPFAVEPDLALHARLDAGDAQQRAALAGAVGADEADDLALVHPQVDVVQHLRPVVKGVEATNAQHRSRRDRRRSPPGSWRCPQASPARSLDLDASRPAAAPRS